MKSKKMWLCITGVFCACVMSALIAHGYMEDMLCVVDKPCPAGWLSDGTGNPAIFCDDYGIFGCGDNCMACSGSDNTGYCICKTDERCSSVPIATVNCGGKTYFSCIRRSVAPYDCICSSTPSGTAPICGVIKCNG